MGFDIAVDDVAVMGVLQSGSQLTGDMYGPEWFKRPLPVQHIFERFAVYIFHYDKIGAVFSAYIKNIDDGRMDETCCRLGLRDEIAPAGFCR